MELSLAVNASLVALQKYAIFYTEPFRIPFAGRVDVYWLGKTGTITAENLVFAGVAGIEVGDKVASMRPSSCRCPRTYSPMPVLVLFRCLLYPYFN